MTVKNSILDMYFSLGRDLIPIRKRDANYGKAPLHTNWQSRKYGLDEIKRYAASNHNIGWRLGPNDLVLDVDPKNGGVSSLKAFLESIKTDRNQLVSTYPTIITGSQGLHFYMRRPDSHKTREVLKAYPGLEFKTQGRQVVIPGSVHPVTGNRYTFLPQSPYRSHPKLCPIRFLHLLRYANNNSGGGAIGAKVKKKELVQILGSIPVDDFREENSWRNLMMAVHAATNGRGLQQFIDWSTSDPMYADHAEIITTRWNSLTPGGGISGDTLLATYREYSPDGYEEMGTRKSHEKFAQSKPKVNVKNPEAKKRHEEAKAQKLSNKDMQDQVVDKILNEKFNKGQYLINARDQQFWEFDGTHWKPMFDNMMMRTICDSIRTFKTARQVKFSISQNLRPVEMLLKAHTATDFDLFRTEIGLPSVINTRNKEIWIDEHTGSIDVKDHSHESYLTSCLDVEYDPKADCPLFKETLADIFSNEGDTQEVIDFLFELYGYILQPNKNIAIWVLFIGVSSANGKTVCLEVLSALAGDASLAESVHNLDTSRNAHVFASLPGKLAIIDEDIRSKTRLPDSTLKKISENKILTANPKGKSAFSFRSHATVLMASNEWPQISDLSDGIRRRAIVVPFNRRFQGAEIDLDRSKRIIDSELSGVLNECLKGLQRLRQRGHFQLPKSCLNAAQQMHYEANPFNSFLMDVYDRVKIPQGKIRKYKFFPKMFIDEIWSDYQDYSMENSLTHTQSKMTLTRTIEQNGFPIKKTRHGRKYVYGLIRKHKKEIN